jgi:hypothetical protein
MVQLGQVVQVKSRTAGGKTLWGYRLKGAIIDVTVQAAASWYSWMRPPSRSRR